VSSYYRLIFILFCTFSFVFAKTDSKIENQFKNDVMILAATDFEQNNKFLEAGEVYLELYNDLKQFEYLKKAIEVYTNIKAFEVVLTISHGNFENHKNDELEFLLQQYIIASVILKKYDNSLKVAKKLIEDFPKSENYFILGDLYFVIGSYQHAKRYYEKAYLLTKNKNALFALTDTLNKYLKDTQKAIEYLEGFKKSEGCSIEICTRLAKYYLEVGESNKMVLILENLYAKYKNGLKQEKLKHVQNYLVGMYESVDVYKAISFLEETGVDFDKLLSLYIVTNQYEKALRFVQNTYVKTKNMKLLGDMAILEFEMANDKNKVIDEVIDKFKKALQTGNNPSFENYYGYLLIEYNIDIKKGLELVKKALQSKPNNYAYKDSVAWGLFKLGFCEDAYSFMKEVVDDVGLDNEEIKTHYNAIRKCIDDIR
jgi:tetratricopeptide (TPR) repeat protein